MNRALKILKPIFFVILILGVIIYFTNGIVLQNKLPAHLKNASWTGTWESTEYPYITGKIITIIPDTLLPNKPFKASAGLYYNIWSIYQPTTLFKIQLTGELGSSNFTGISINETSILDNIEEMPSEFFKAKMDIGNGQIIEYQGKPNNDITEIKGTYSSIFPFDEGIFSIKLKNNK